MKLLYVGNGNFDYYLSNDGKYVEYKAKPGTGCDNGVFGSIKYFKYWLENEIAKNKLDQASIKRL